MNYSLLNKIKRTKKEKTVIGTLIPRVVGDIGFAKRNLLKGNKVSRVAWDGKDMWLVLLEPTLVGETFGGYPVSPYVALKTEDGKIAHWTYTMEDFLAEDYVVINFA